MGGQSRHPSEVANAPSLSVFKGHLDNALNNILEFLVSPELVRQLNWMIAVVPSNRNSKFFSVPFHDINKKNMGLNFHQKIHTAWYCPDSKEFL